MDEADCVPDRACRHCHAPLTDNNAKRGTCDLCHAMRDWAEADPDEPPEPGATFDGETWRT